MPTVKCAIYVRKSTEKGLEQNFNSLHNQEEACKNYILSQAFNGWEYSKTYEDGGISGGTMKRPGLETLIDDIKRGKVQTVVVYKVDRLSRSIIDFHKMMKMFEEHNCNFVSITQSFDTSTSMGKLTLNMLLSFAQFEREVSSERVRDKIASSKAKGYWMGGHPPLGYDIIEKQLIINPGEAKKVQLIFDLYQKYKSIYAVRNYLNENNILTKRWIAKSSGRSMGGCKWSGSSVRHILKNHTYLGKINFKDNIYEGQHERIISKEVWEECQKILKSFSNNTLGMKKKKRSTILSNKIFFQKKLMKPMYSKKRIYYVVDGQYIPANQLHNTIEDNLQKWITSESNLLEIDLQESLLYINLKHLPISKKEDFIKQIICKVEFENKSIFRLEIDTEKLNDLNGFKGSSRQEAKENIFEIIYKEGSNIIIRLPFTSHKLSYKILNETESVNISEELVQALTIGWKYRKLYEGGLTVNQIAVKEQKGNRFVYRHLGLGYLSPQITEKVLDGKISPPLDTLIQVTSYHKWKDQYKTLK